MDNQHDGLLVHKAQRLISIVASDVFAVTKLYKEQMDVLVKLALMNFRESSVVQHLFYLLKQPVVVNRWLGIFTP